MLIRTVTTVSALNSAGQVVEALPVREAATGETDIVGRPVTPIDVVEDVNGVPVRFVTGKSAVNSAGQVVDTIAVKSGGSPAISNAALLAALPADPLIAEVGGSRERQNGIGASNQIRTMSMGQLMWARMQGQNFRSSFYYDAAGQSAMNGLTFAQDGEGFIQMKQRVPKILASDVHLVIVALSSNSVQFNNPDGSTFSVDGYLNLVKPMILDLIAGGKAVMVKELWERGTNAGGPWQANNAPRLLIPSINAAMKTWCQDNGVPFIEVRSTFVDLASPNKEPVTALVRPDLTHLSTLGGKAMGDIFMAALAPYLKAVPARDLLTGNLVTNAAMSGTGGTVGAGATGQAPDSHTLARTGATTATVSSAVIVKDGKRWTEITIDTSTMTAATAEGFTLTPAAITVVSGKWYVPKVRFEVDAFNGWLGAPQIRSTTGANSSFGMAPTNSGGSAETAVSTAVLPGPAVAYTGVLEGMPSLGTTTSASIYAAMYFAPGSGIAKIRFTEIALQEVPDPALFLYDETNTTPLTFTSSATMTTPEEQPFATVVTTSRPASFSLSGTNAALFSIDQYGNLTAGAFDADAGGSNVYTFTITAKPYNLSLPSVNQNVTLTVTNIDDGYTDLFTGTNGTDLADYSPNWTRVGGASGAITIDTNAAKNNSVSGAIAVTGYMAPQQGDTRYQQIRYTPASSSAGPRQAVLMQDEANALYLVNGSAVVQVGRLNAGTPTTLFSTVPYKSIGANTDEIIGNIYNDGTNDILQVLQNGVEIGSGIVTGILPAARRSGLVSNQSSGSGNRTDKWNNRPSSGKIISKVGLRALTMTPLTGAAGADYAGALSNRTTNSSISVVVTKSSVAQPDWLADGDFIRCSAVTAGTYTVTVTESFAGAVNNNLQTVFTVVIS
ncbi:MULTISPECIES: SGNH/GDSL hydrolase family protein [unclassified Rhizobium]|uniref:SGNH/GDSL hydrolase family protein n=1 Tax=unclassified Rhizobium TaxID=2613769 RepID=UPI002889CDD7|nr:MULTISPECIES: SGNH/GDSL hydrolase family protein [unclassified Rhizobium]